MNDERDITQRDPKRPDDDDGDEPEAVYPPAADEAAETRRVQENLRRWEVAERQRRKAARESQSGGSVSLVAGVSQRASLLWGSRQHAALESTDSVDVVPLNRISANSPSPTPSPSSETPTPPTDPFANPLSPFDDTHASTNAKGKQPSRPPIPQPLNLPPPRSPPPIIAPAATTTNAPPQKDKQDVRWWHDWLCGCGEGPDRGGDSQAGRTNPFE